jgi:hypothetical protein
VGLDELLARNCDMGGETSTSEKGGVLEDKEIAMEKHVGIHASEAVLDETTEKK